MWTRGKFYQEYVPGLFAVMVDSYRQMRAKSLWEKAVTVKTSGKMKEENTLRSGLGLPTVKGEGAPISYDSQIAGPLKTWSPTVYALGVRVTEEAIEDHLSEMNGGGAGVLADISKDLGISLAENIEVEIAKFLVSGTAATYHTTRFGDELFDTAHDRLDGSTYSNYGTSSDLTYDTFWAAVVTAENQLDHRQLRVRKDVNRLWVPPQMEKKAIEILQSTDRPDTGNRAINALKASGRKIDLAVWSYLTDADAWYLQLDGDGIIFFWRRKTRFAREADFQTGDMQLKGDQRFSAEINDPMCWYGNIPA
jgi:hypothetical protein